MPVLLAQSMVNRHGLIAGATGTGKTKTLQVLAGQLSDAGVPVFVADVKGDLTGLGAPGDAADPKVQARCQQLGWTFAPKAHPIRLLSLAGKLGAQVRATVHSFGPLLLSKVLDLNVTQTAVLSLVFEYCDDRQLPLLDLEDLKTTLQYLASDDAKPVLAEYGGMAPSTLGVIRRSIVTLEQQGADAFFGEPEFDVDDLLGVNGDGTGMIHVLELSDVMDKPALFSTFMLWLLAQLYSSLPEVGDQPKAKLAFFFDEAHLLFDDASEALLGQVELVARLVRSKGVGLYMVTQSPTDVAPKVLAQRRGPPGCESEEGPYRGGRHRQEGHEVRHVASRPGHSPRRARHTVRQALGGRARRARGSGLRPPAAGRQGVDLPTSTSGRGPLERSRRRLRSR
ncbi:MAG: helicase HerA-like domain-containing protein [Actinomycetota bacterium]